MTPVSNATGDFSRNLMLFTLKYKKPLDDNSLLRFGGGIGQYSSGKLEIDSDVLLEDATFNYKKLEIEYKTATGFHLTAEYVKKLQPGLHLNAGVKFYSVTYEPDTGKADGQDLIFDNGSDFDGSGLDITVGVSKYF
jgi:hypothetical protein